MLFGGYVNVEGEADVRPLDSVSTMTLDQEAQFSDATRWRQFQHRHDDDDDNDDEDDDVLARGV